MKRSLFALMLAAVMLMAACSNGGSNNGSNAGQTGTGTDDAPDSKSDKLKVVLLVPGTLGDKSFFDAANSGLTQVKDTLQAETKVIEMGADTSKWEPTFNSVAAQDWDVIISGGSQITELLNATAEQHPDKKFVNYDTDIPETAANVYAISYATNEVSFLAGAAAALTSVSEMPSANADKKIGFLGGMDIPGINAFLIGYIEGAKYAVPDIKVAVSYAGDFADPGKGKELSLLQYNSGVDVIFNVAGGTGLGVFDAAKEKGRYAVGVDSDQASMLAGTDNEKANLILTSAVKKIDQAILRTVRGIQVGTLEMGKLEVVGLEEDGVGIVRNDIFNSVVSEDVKAKVLEIEKKLIANEIEVGNAMGMETSEIEQTRNSVKP
ncbi:BMP family ABC transporter substrate-binding protein [Paenibacillus sp. LHD-117]|uniref:BMP family ABC transporter substrate-binding protein n=1 Tax=Paenibacillus sp. LHD-117 TaxID=3071412 RepID=UPI0027E09E34|nr:BMP family ABC transporter substrate-binding protein [Paenibacillus sp. LHD-117]MDQ6418790.1 BMP family ABC transporter substrate-binding protein [Paenibacillus sp. LHD-117]